MCPQTLCRNRDPTIVGTLWEGTGTDQRSTRLVSLANVMTALPMSLMNPALKLDDSNRSFSTPLLGCLVCLDPLAVGIDEAAVIGDGAVCLLHWVHSGTAIDLYSLVDQGSKP